MALELRVLHSQFTANAPPAPAQRSMEGTLTLARIVLVGPLIWLAAPAVNRTCLGWHWSRW